MTPARSVADLLSKPWGRYYLGRRHIVFSYTPTLLGHVAWGRPSFDDVRELLQACEIGLDRDAVPHAWLADLRELEYVEPSSFGLFAEYVRSRANELRKNITRQAQLRPTGMVGAIIAGFSHVARPPYPERVFTDIGEAIEWLGVATDVGRSALAELDSIRSSALGLDPTITRLRRELEMNGAISLDAAARRLGLSVRSLQRTLGQCGTTYRAEVHRLQMQNAMRLLRDSDGNLAWIAKQVGFASLQHFATAFRRSTGETPSAFRERVRRGGPTADS